MNSLTSQREFLYYEWLIFDNCNLRCSYCINKGEYSHKKKEDILYIEGKEIDVANKIGELSSIAENMVVNFTGGEPLLAKHFSEVLKIIYDIDNLKLQMYTNLIHPEKLEGYISKFNKIIVSLHVKYRDEKDIDRLIASINEFKTGNNLIISQLDYNLDKDDRKKLEKVSLKTGLPIDFQTFIPSWTEEGKIENSKEILDSSFKKSLSKRCSLGYFCFFLRPDGTFFYDLWCDGRQQKCGDFLKVDIDNFQDYFLADMKKCPKSSCGCNYNTFYYDYYKRACDRLKYPKEEIFPRVHVKLLQRVLRKIERLKIDFWS